jgi:hypothetical protein
MRHTLYLVLMLSAHAFASTNYVAHAQTMPAIRTPPREPPLASDRYRGEAVRLLIEEANSVAHDLQLDERLPIVEADLAARYVPGLPIAQRTRIVGNVTTSNYTYYVSIDNKFSFLERTGLTREYERLKQGCLWPMSRLDTNAALTLATQLLASASMDVDSLNREGRVNVLAFTPEGKGGAHFVPIYWVYWMPKDSNGSGSIASVELFTPTRLLLQMRVEKSKYILRRPLPVERWQAQSAKQAQPQPAEQETPK